MHVQSAFLYNLYKHDRKFPFATLFGGRKHKDKLSLSESELGCGPQDSVEKFTYIFYFKRIDGINAKTLKKKKKEARIDFDS